jgi:hypothetical protein
MWDWPKIFFLYYVREKKETKGEPEVYMSSGFPKDSQGCLLHVSSWRNQFVMVSNTFKITIDKWSSIAERFCVSDESIEIILIQ